MKRSILLLTSALILTFTMSSCEDNDTPNNTLPHYTRFGFKESETVIEVDKTVTSFKIEGEFVEDLDKEIVSRDPGVYLFTEATTARHKVHFVNKVTEYNTVGEFTVMEGRKAYYEVEIIPENITEEVRIVYDTKFFVNDGEVFTEPDRTITTTTIILTPKK